MLSQSERGKESSMEMDTQGLILCVCVSKAHPLKWYMTGLIPTVCVCGCVCGDGEEEEGVGGVSG